jgi:hypothetical protein
MNTPSRYYLISLDASGLCDIGHYDDLAIARLGAHVMRLADPFSAYAVFDAWDQKIVSGWARMPANTDRRTA